MSTDKLIHDWLLEHRPEGATHEDAECAHCTITSEQEEVVTDEQKIYTQEMHEQLVASAVEKALNEAQAASDAEILSLNERLEAAEGGLVERDEKIEELSSVISDREDTDRLEALAIERVELVKAAANFSDEQIETRKLAWAEMSEEAFTAYLDDIRAAAKAPKSEEKVPETEFDGTRETAGEEGTEVAAVKAFFGEALATAAQM
jgi:RNA-splicing ligase RtcB